MTTVAPPCLSAHQVGKRFGSLRALTDVDFEVRAGEIHAVLGENGAGKSTLMRVLAGADRPDAGHILVDGKRVTFASPRAARTAGIGMVYQHFTLVDALTVAENLALSVPHEGLVWFCPERTDAAARAVAARVGLELSPPKTLVGQLPVGARQRLEILKALAAAGRVLILDEPTAVLTPQEVRHLFEMLGRLRAAGCAIVFITHKLHEVKAIADRVTIIRHGQVVASVACATISEQQMAELMVGAVLPARTHAPRPVSDAALALEVTELQVRRERGGAAALDVTMEVRAGEIFGIAGVDGNGQRELFEVLVGARQPARGTVRVHGTPLARFTPRAARQAGIGHIPPDRQETGLALSMTVAENFLLNAVILARFTSRGLLRGAAARRFAANLRARFSIDCASLDLPVRALSGGTQQRVIVARELAQEPRVLIAVNPTRGLDVRAAGEVAEAVRAIAGRGCAVLLISTDLEEVLDWSDRIAVLSRGRLSAPLTPPVAPERLGLLMAGTSP